MSSFKQIEANRRNASKSTGPTTDEGKERSRCNAVRHGLTAETVIADLEDAADYQAFEAAVVADYDAQTAVERELVLRLASVLWRLRRAIGIESGIFESVTERSVKDDDPSSGGAPDRLYVVTAYPSGEGHGMVVFLIGGGTGQAASAAMFVGRQFQGSSSWMRLAG